MFCSYKNIFGEPNKGFHKTRIFGLAAYDVLGLLLLNWAISYYYKIDFIPLLCVLILLTVIIHYLFCVPTAFNVAIGLAEPSADERRQSIPHPDEIPTD